ncbi:hypothetical protein [Streptomyces sp. NPDC014656]|uniref:hypothetical protein n=1 Tax=Streptomyces sp. NPDC014656 TaxID=3364878 RepID=UPI0036F73345
MTTWLASTGFARYALIPEALFPTWEGTEADEVIDEYVAALRLAGTQRRPGQARSSPTLGSSSAWGAGS